MLTILWSRDTRVVIPAPRIPAAVEPNVNHDKVSLGNGKICFAKPAGRSLTENETSDGRLLIASSKVALDLPSLSALLPILIDAIASKTAPNGKAITASRASIEPVMLES